MYYKFVVAGIVIWLITATAVARYDKLPVKQAFLLLLFTGLMFFLGARLHSLILEQQIPIADLVRHPTLLIAGGFRLPGGVALSLLFLAAAGAVSRFPVQRLLDPIAIGCPLAMATARLGCFFEGCCFGTASHLPWAVTYPFGSEAYRSHVAQGVLEPGMFASLPVHPLALYMSLASLLTFGALVYLWPRRVVAGEVLIALLALRSVSAVAIEALREQPSIPVPFRSGFWLAVAVLALLAWMAIRFGHAGRPGRHGGPSRLRPGLTA